MTKCIECDNVIHHVRTPFCKSCAQAFYNADNPSGIRANTDDSEVINVDQCEC